MSAQSPAPGADSEPFRTMPAPFGARSRVACFSIQAEAEAGILPRVLEIFAKRGLVPRRWVSDVTGPGSRELSIDVMSPALRLRARPTSPVACVRFGVSPWC